MNSVEPVRTTPPVQSDAGGEIRAATHSVSLLPPPSESQLDALSVLYMLYADNRAHNLKVARSDLEAAQNMRRKAWEKVKKALADAAKAKAKEKSSFWNKLANVATKVAKVAAVVGSVALAVSSAGAATPIAALAIAGAVMSTGAFVQGETQFLQKLGVDSTTANSISIGLSVGGGVASGGVAIANIAGCGAQAASAAQQAVETGGRVATAASGIAHAASGVATVQASRHAGGAEAKLADAAAARLEEQRWQRMFVRIVEALEQAQEQDERILGSLRGAVETKSRTLIDSAVRV